MQALLQIAGFLLAVLSAAGIVIGIETLNGSESLARRRALVEHRRRD